MKHVSHFYNAFLWALTAGMIAYSSWMLQMAFNTGYIFYGVLIVAFALLCVFRRKQERGIGLAGTTASLMTMIMCALIWIGPSRSLLRAPAAFAREGLHLNRFPLDVMSFILLAIVIVGFVAIVVYEVKNPAPKKELAEDEAKLQRTNRIARWATFVALFVVVAICSCVPAIREEMGTIFKLLSSGDISAVADLIASYGPWAAGVSFCLMVLQSMAAPIPAFLITFSNAAVFGWWQGAILSWSSAMAGAAVCFFIARILGRDAVANFVSHGALASVDKFFERYGKNAILICRLLPFMSFDYVSYAAGLTGMGFLDFFIATGIGQLPATIVYSYVGGMLTGSAQLVMTALLITFALFALIFLVRQVFKARHADLMDESDNTADTSEVVQAEAK
ncbi:TVP38/TMEM64 family protein [Adlercreutzia sp. ZJ141]|uniref:TVP38/TMEM64 family protein n=1 Tax=Adlercreutzia sp. ZJ141 TaxID=2709406 RepID=UPI00197D9321|nr:TVP38/TMEM64 family protein [Adlercreutzia sp. ZJ141]